MATTTPKSKTNYGGLLLRGGIYHIRKTIKGVTIAESTHTGNRRQAERILAARVAELTDEVVLGKRRPIKLHAAIDLFVKSRAHLPSHQGCEIHLRYFKRIADTTLDRVTDADLQGVIAARRAEGYAESTLKVSVTYFNAMLNYCEEHGYTTRKRMKTIKGVKGKIRWLTREELAALYRALDPALGVDAKTQEQKQDNFDLVRLLYETGCRLTEISDMRWQQIDLDAGTMYIHRLKGSISNTIEITRNMREILERRLKAGGEYLFPNKVGKNNNAVWMRAAVKRAGLSSEAGSVTLHTLRHTKCVHLLQAGLGLLELKDWIGHRDIASTLVYSHVVSRDVASKVRAIGQRAHPVPDTLVQGQSGT